ncbi:glycosyltransferase [Shewanella colwelliana]|uniref:glycosyltransferase family 2 protein n=1 Tax=Shewanella colwelliana TaxID=23 RepID=UPI00299D6E7D|nr:glycosyltransferase [Shewanella colwelliana]MDX1281573.1 glycosyltransferase [Shewanella colwelliana]
MSAKLNPNPSISIVIPTRNRSECAIKCVLSCLEAAKKSEVIILDSSEDDSLNKLVVEMVDPSNIARVKYYKTDERLNVVENFESGLQYCTGDFVTYLGDDDLLGPNIDKICQWAKRHGVDSIVSYGLSFGVSYYWPGVSSKYFGDAYNAKLFVKSMTGNIEHINLTKEMRLTKNNIGFGLAKLPRIYHGIVSLNLIREVLGAHGKLFGGVSPDIYSAVLLSHYCKSPVFIDYPICVPGASPKSEAGSGAARTDRDSFHGSAYLSRFKNLEWNELVPKFFSPYNVWGYSMAEAIIDSGRKVEPEFYAKIYIRCLVYCFSYRAEIFRAYRIYLKEYGIFRGLFCTAKAALSEVAFSFVKYGNKIIHMKAGEGATQYSNIVDSLSAHYLLLELQEESFLEKMEH